jgi:hypothetical protein
MARLAPEHAVRAAAANMIAAKVNFAGQVRPSIDSIELPDGRTLTAFHSSYY